jgi:imidazolonepropionase-like amidohydrolase
LPTAPTSGKAITRRTLRSCANALQPSETLFAATRNAADLIGATDEIGSIQPGRYADIVATAGDPFSDPARFDACTSS